MKIETYQKKLKELEEKFKERKSDLSKKFAIENGSYKIGDILKDHYKIILVEKINWGYKYSNNTPQCYYCGPILKKKDLKPYVSGENSTMSQENVKELIKKEKKIKSKTGG